MKISSGKTVSIEYTMSFEGGSPVETTVGKDPLSYVQGRHELLEGIEQALEGLEAGGAKTVSLEPDQAFGMVDPEAILDVEASELPEDARQEGAMVETEDDQGEPMAGKVIRLSGETATIDFNHPLAGKTLQFDIKVLSVSEGGKGEQLSQLDSGKTS